MLGLGHLDRPPCPRIDPHAPILAALDHVAQIYPDAQYDPPVSVFVSRTVFNHVRGKVKLGFDDLGDQQLKNIAEPVRVYRLRASGEPMPRPSLALPDKPSIAVLPFRNMSGEPEQEYFADGMVDDIITALSRFRGLFVIARNSSFAYKASIRPLSTPFSATPEILRLPDVR
jgi:hypothetical protein